MHPWVERARTWWQKSSPRKRLYAVLAAISLLATGTFFAITGSPEAAGQSGTNDTLFYFDVLLKLAGVLLLFVGGALILRRWQTGRRGGGLSRQLNVVESVRLSPKQALHLVRVGDRHLLVGATDQAIAFLSAVELAETPAGAAQELPVDFSAILSSFTQRQPEKPADTPRS